MFCAVRFAEASAIWRDKLAAGEHPAVGNRRESRENLRATATQLFLWGVITLVEQPGMVSAVDAPRFCFRRGVREKNSTPATPGA